MEEKLIQAPVDDKNVTTDWLESIFDSDDFARDTCRMVGFICGCVVSARWYANVVDWLISQDMGGDYVTAMIILEERLRKAESPEQGIYSKIEHSREGRYGIRQKFYFRDEG